MKILPEKPTVYFDIDDTLILWRKEMVPDKWKPYGILFGKNKDIKGWPHQKHIELLKQFKARDHNVIIWSSGGSNWAAHVIDVLGLTDYVDFITPKPHWFVDDLLGKDILLNYQRIYLNPFKNRKKIKIQEKEIFNAFFGTKMD
jgi:hypothetical protein